MDDPNSENLNEDSASTDYEDSEIELDFEDIENHKKWKLDYEEEVKFWEKLIDKGYIYMDDICPVCKIGKYEIKKYTRKDICKIFYCPCSYIKCRKKSDLRNYSI